MDLDVNLKNIIKLKCYNEDTVSRESTHIGYFLTNVKISLIVSGTKDSYFFWGGENISPELTPAANPALFAEEDWP